ncbi:hypothetical protein EP331_01515 [bacterium]|nr:MAG: hypothetical protein EP331_01515 [bacterium]
MMYVKTNLSKAPSVTPKRVSSMGVPLNEVKQKKTAKVFGAPSTEKTEKKGKGISAGKVIFFTLIFGAVGLMYLNHVFSTQQRLKEVLELQREYEKVKRVYADRKFTYDRMIGPAEVYERAKKLGLKDGGPANGIIYVEK